MDIQGKGQEIDSLVDLIVELMNREGTEADGGTEGDLMVQVMVDTTEEAEQLGKELEELKIPCEVYSRVVGYIRPIQSWNQGKVQEHKDRVFYQMELPSMEGHGISHEVVGTIPEKVLKDLRNGSWVEEEKHSGGDFTGEWQGGQGEQETLVSIEEIAGPENVQKVFDFFLDTGLEIGVGVGVGVGDEDIDPEEYLSLVR